MVETRFPLWAPSGQRMWSPHDPTVTKIRQNYHVSLFTWKKTPPSLFYAHPPYFPPPPLSRATFGDFLNRRNPNLGFYSQHLLSIFSSLAQIEDESNGAETKGRRRSAWHKEAQACRFHPNWYGVPQICYISHQLGILLCFVLLFIRDFIHFLAQKFWTNYL